MLADPRRNQRSNQPGQLPAALHADAGVVLPFVASGAGGLGGSGSSIRTGRSGETSSLSGPKLASEVFDDLTDLFLGESSGPATYTNDEPPVSDQSQDERPLAPDRREHRSVESLLLGHLPVLAVAWTGQYLRMRSVQLGGPVLSLRVGGDWARVELFSHQPLEAEQFAAITQAIEHGKVNSAAAAVTLAQSLVVGSVLWAGPSEELRIATLANVTDRTLLTGADEAAVVAAYSMIKGLAGAGRPAPAGEAAQHAGIRLAVVGCDNGTALGVAERLNIAARHFLNVEIEFAGHLPKIGAGIAPTLLYDGPLGEGLESLIARLNTVTDAGRQVTRPLTSDHREAVRVPVAPRNTAAMAEPKSAAPRPVHAAPTQHAATHGHAQAQVQVIRPAKQSAPAIDSLAMYVPGLRPLGLRCAVEPTVELAVDDLSTLHLLTEVDSAGVDTHCRAAVILQRAKRWAVEHEALIAPMLSSVTSIARAAACPTVHLLTAWPLHAEMLRGSEVLVHAVMVVEPGTGTASVRVM